jgi:thiopurine S-methyltransferase
MDRKYWIERWTHGQIGFHQPEYNRFLVRHWPELGLAPGGKAFLPMCGKTQDLRWLAEQGYDVLGVEFSPIAIEAFFADCGVDFERKSGTNLPCYSSGCTHIYCGDFFELTADELAGTTGVFDRAALVALPPAMRARYADHLLRIIPANAEILLVTCEFDQNLVAGPPFAVYDDEVEALYGERCRITPLACEVTENVPPHFEVQGVSCLGERAYRIQKIA